jgi:shikimate kinase
MGAPLRSLLLVGMRGAGKSAAGRAAAALLDIPFIDLDGLALSRCAAESIASAFASPGGEARWRAAERNALEEVTSSMRGPAIVAVGAGAAMHGPTQSLIHGAKANGWRVVHLRVSAPTCEQRLARDDGGRPSLTGAPVPHEIAALHAQRTPTYESLGDLDVDGERPLAEVAASIARAAIAS